MPLAIHGVIAAGLLGVDPSRLLRRDSVVEMEVQEKPLPPPELRPVLRVGSVNQPKQNCHVSFDEH